MMCFTLPTCIKAGNYFETEDYFPFFVANISDILFPDKVKNESLFERKCFDANVLLVDFDSNF
ncbi:MAG: hypothetical protein ACJA0G_001943 [Kangiellaceae bacterium]|jgi:hypothetical protein